jgi:hypothetical protein
VVGLLQGRFEDAMALMKLIMHIPSRAKIPFFAFKIFQHQLADIGMKLSDFVRAMQDHKRTTTPKQSTLLYGDIGSSKRSCRIKLPL